MQPVGWLLILSNPNYWERLDQLEDSGKRCRRSTPKKRSISQKLEENTNNNLVYKSFEYVGTNTLKRDIRQYKAILLLLHNMIRWTSSRSVHAGFLHFSLRHWNMDHENHLTQAHRCLLDVMLLETALEDLIDSQNNQRLNSERTWSWNALSVCFYLPPANTWHRAL